MVTEFLFKNSYIIKFSNSAIIVNRMIAGMKVAKKIVITCDRNKLKEVLLPMLREKVFHVTSLKAYQGIVKDNIIYSNKDSRFKYSFDQSKISYGRKRGCVCLLDLRNKDDVVIEEALTKYYFLNPSHQKISIFLILAQKLYPKLIYDTEAKKDAGYKEMYIPHVECWYPGNIPLKYIDEVLKVRITGQDDDYNPYKNQTKEQKEHLLETMKSYDFMSRAGLELSC